MELARLEGGSETASQVSKGFGVDEQQGSNIDNLVAKGRSLTSSESEDDEDMMGTLDAGD